MWRKVLIRAVAVAGLAAVSVAAYASTFSDKEPEKADIQIVAGESAIYRRQPEIAEPQPAGAGMDMGTDHDGEESYLLAKIAMAEAESEDTEGKALVMLVVLNRV